MQGGSLATRDDKSVWAASHSGDAAGERCTRPPDLQSRSKQEIFRMRLFPRKSGRARVIFAEACAALAIAVLIGGCGDNYRPVVTPINTSGPAAQPTSYAVVVSAPSPTAPGVVTIIDYSGDSIMTETPIGPGPRVFSMDELGATGYTLNSDGTLSNFAITTSLQPKNSPSPRCRPRRRW